MDDLESSSNKINTYLYECQHHGTKSFINLNAYRKSGTLCDVTVKIGNFNFQAHKVILSCGSPYFHAMFTSGLREENADLVELHDLDPHSVSLLLDFIYTSKIEILEENVQRLLPASNVLQLQAVRDACCDFLREQLDPCNALGILVFADTHGCQDLVNTTSLYVLKNFLHISQMEEFLSLPCERVKFFLSSDNLVVGEEENVYSALMKWMKHDLINRKTYLPELLGCVRLPLLHKDFLMLTVEPEDIIKCDPLCKDLLIEAMKYHLMPEMRRYFQTIRTKPRQSEGNIPLVYIIGGQSLFAIHSDCEVYNPTNETWQQISAMTIRRSRIGVGVVYDKLYVVGGFDGSQDLASVEVFNGVTKTWSSGLQMGTNRSCLCVAVLHNLLYAVGGYDGSSCLSSVERFDPLSNQWMSVAMMNSKRRYVSVGVVNEHIVAAGGYDGGDHLNSCEIYDPVSNVWTNRSSMLNNRSSAGGCVLNGYFYVSGGTDGSVIINSCERFDMQNDEWMTILSMSSVRMTHMLVAFSQTKLLAIGGNDGSGSLNSVEEYDSEKDEWTAKPSSTLRRSHLAATLMCSPMAV